MTWKGVESKKCVTEPPSKFIFNFKNYLGYLRISYKLLIRKHQQFVKQILKEKQLWTDLGSFLSQDDLPCAGRGKLRPWISIISHVKTVVLLTAPTGVLAEWGAHSFGFLSALLFPKNNSHIEVENTHFLYSHFLSTSPMKDKLGSSKENSEQVCVMWLQSCLTLCNPVEYSLPVSCVHEILHAGILEWVAISFSKGSSWPRDPTCISLYFLH